MKIYLTSFFLFLFLVDVKSQEIYSYYHGEKIFYSFSNKKAVVGYKKQSNKSKLTSLTGNGVKSVISTNDIYHSVIVDLEKDSVNNFLSMIKKDSSTLFASPVLVNDRGQEIGGLTDQFIVKLKSNSGLLLLNDISLRFKIAKIQQYEFNKLIYFLSVSKEESKNSMDLANIFYETNLFEWVEPNFFLFINKETNDTYYNQQWSIYGNNGHNMQVDLAWNISTGCNNVRIAIIDEGVELNHPDLQANLIQGFDAIDGTSAGANTNGDAHGTACAGIVGAISNNGIGIAGIANTSRIIPVRAYTQTSSINSTTVAGWMAAGIDWASHNGADILSCSWVMNVGQQIIEDAITWAVNNGRNGLGCSVLFAAGNDGSNSVSFPANLGNVVAVGSSSSGDTRSSFSNYGTGLDIVAPGENIHTTDLQSTTGYNTASTASGGDYHPRFTGTSAATPNAAGVMALILAVNPNLTQTQARQILESTCNKVSGYVYSSSVAGQPNGTWNSEVGYGRVNAYQAVLKASQINTSSNPVCSTSTFSLQYSQPVTWSSSNQSGLSINSSTGVATRINNFNGQVTVTANLNGCAGPKTFTKTVRVGTYTHSDYSIIETITNGVHQYGLGSWMIVDGSATYNWSWRNYNYVSGQGTRVVTLNPIGTSGGYVGLSIGNACGWSDPNPLQFFPYKASFAVTASPNPAASILTVQMIDSTDNNSPSQLQQSYQVILYNRMSQTVYSIQSSDKSIQIPLGNLPDDIYYLNVIYKKAVLQRQFVVKR